MTKKDLDYFKTYGWTCSEENLKTLPPSAPQGAKDLSKWLTLEGRRSSLTEWLNHVQEDGKIHGKFWHIGAWTGRMSHSSPNQGNIFAVWPDEVVPSTPIEEIKERYDSDLRSCWRASKDKWLVGTDAEGIQLRILAHYMDSKDYVKAITKGNKDDKTDIHNLNKSALGPICKSRDDAKTFVYAWLLGAGIPKVGSILHCSTPQASKAVSNFLASLPELNRLKKIKIPRDARLGYFTGLDGRRVPCSSEHLMLSGYLQNGEKVIMAHANVLWRRKVEYLGVKYKQLDFVHDEWVVECKSMNDADFIGRAQCQAIEDTGVMLGLRCPLAGKYNIGQTWKDIH